MPGTEVTRIIDQLERGFRGEAWHGTPLRQLLDDVDATTASRRLLPGAHTIWEITLHITAWLTVARRRTAGEVVTLSGDEDWPAVPDPGAAAWQATLADLDRAHDRLLALVRTLDDPDLDRPVAGTAYSVYVLLHGVLQHNLYHAGQVALLARGARGSR